MSGCCWRRARAHKVGVILLVQVTTDLYGAAQNEGSDGLACTAGVRTLHSGSACLALCHALRPVR
jgi:hypothetical protein